jgi:undecaprenyl-diphosphatase
VSWTVAIVVGLAQIVAGIFPGISRSGATIFAAMLAGTSNRPAATEFAFLVGIPTMCAASAYELYRSVFKQGAGHEDWSALGVAFIISAVTAFIAVKWLLDYIQSHRFTAFAIYRVVFGAALLGMAALSAELINTSRKSGRVSIWWTQSASKPSKCDAGNCGAGCEGCRARNFLTPHEQDQS